MKTSRRIAKGLQRASPRTRRVALGAGAALAVAGAVGVALKVLANRKVKRAATRAGAERREDLEAVTRMDAEGASLRPVTPRA